VKDANGAVIAVSSHPDFSFTSQVIFQATSTTTVLSIGASPDSPSDFGQYIVRVNDGSPLDAMVENIRVQPSHPMCIS